MWPQRGRDFGTPDLERGIHLKDDSKNGVWYFERTKFFFNSQWEWAVAWNEVLKIDLFLERDIILIRTSFF